MALGEHWMIDIYDFPKTTIERSLEVLLEAAKIMKANVIKSFSTETEHENVALVIIDESHLSIHDYRNKFAVDFGLLHKTSNDKIYLAAVAQNFTSRKTSYIDRIYKVSALLNSLFLSNK